MNMTQEQIAEQAQDATSIRAERIIINALYRKQDDSHLWPLCNKFNATNRAINRVLKFERDSGCGLYGLEYCYAIDNEISNIVNDPNL